MTCARWRQDSIPNGTDATYCVISSHDAGPAADGVKNLLKYGLGLNPWTPVSTADLPEISPDGVDNLILFYRERTDL